MNLIERIERKIVPDFYYPRNALYFENTNYLNLIILKNGFSSLGNVYLYSNGFEMIDDDIWGEIMRKIGNFDNFCTVYRKYRPKTFVVYRDPYERFVSLYKDCVSSDNNHKELKMHCNLSTEELVKNPALFLRLLDRKIEWNDWHIIGQIEMIRQNTFMRRIHTVVEMKNLSTFIERELKVPYNLIPHSNQTSKDIDVSCFEQYRDVIEEYYKEDYQIPIKYKKKLYVPE